MAVHRVARAHQPVDAAVGPTVGRPGQRQRRARGPRVWSSALDQGLVATARVEVGGADAAPPGPGQVTATTPPFLPACCAPAGRPGAVARATSRRPRWRGSPGSCRGVDVLAAGRAVARGGAGQAGEAVEEDAGVVAAPAGITSSLARPHVAPTTWRRTLELAPGRLVGPVHDAGAGRGTRQRAQVVAGTGCALPGRARAGVVGDVRRGHDQRVGGVLRVDVGARGHAGPADAQVTCVRSSHRVGVGPRARRRRALPRAALGDHEALDAPLAAALYEPTATHAGDAGAHDGAQLGRLALPERRRRQGSPRPRRARRP